MYIRFHNFDTIETMRGFSLLEALLIAGIIGVLAAAIAPFTFPSSARDELAASAESLVAALRQAQLSSLAVTHASTHGVHLEAGRFVLFEGANYASRNPAFDLITTLPPGVTLTSALTDIVFDKFTGKTNAAGTITLSTAGASRLITINSLGRAMLE